MDKTLADYIKRLQEQDPIPDQPVDQYPVYPELHGEEDRPQNPYSPV